MLLVAASLPAIWRRELALGKVGHGVLYSRRMHVPDWWTEGLFMAELAGWRSQREIEGETCLNETLYQLGRR